MVTFEEIDSKASSSESDDSSTEPEPRREELPSPSRRLSSPNPTGLSVDDRRAFLNALDAAGGLRRNACCAAILSSLVTQKTQRVQNERNNFRILRTSGKRRAPSNLKIFVKPYLVLRHLPVAEDPQVDHPVLLRVCRNQLLSLLRHVREVLQVTQAEILEQASWPQT